MVKSKRPLAITILSIVMVTFSLVLIYLRIQNLRSLPSLNPFIETILNQNFGTPVEGISVNVAFFSDIAILSISFIPLILGVGLWKLYGWARAISICLLISVVIPRTSAAIGIITDKGTTVGTNLLISLASAIGLLILLHPQIIIIFRRNTARKK